MFAVRVENDYIGLMGRHVVEGQWVSRGAPLIDIMTPEGVVETIISEAWGVVAHIEGGRIFRKLDLDDEREEGDDEDDDDSGESGTVRGSSGGSDAVFPKGSMICHVVSRNGREAGTIKGLTPRPSQSLRMRRMGLAPTVR